MAGRAWETRRSYSGCGTRKVKMRALRAFLPAGVFLLSQKRQFTQSVLPVHSHRPFFAACGFFEGAVPGLCFIPVGLCVVDFFLGLPRVPSRYSSPTSASSFSRRRSIVSSCNSSAKARVLVVSL